MTMEQLDKAGSLLAESEKGRQAMRDLLAFLDNGAIGLDEQTKQQSWLCSMEPGESMRGRLGM